MAEEQQKPNPSNDSKNQEKASDLQKKILDLKKQEKQLYTEIDKLSDKSLENHDKSLKSIKDYTDMLKDVVKQRKLIQDQLKDISKKSKEEETLTSSIGENLKNSIKSYRELSEIQKQKLDLGEKIQKLEAKKIDPKISLQAGKEFLAQKIKELDAEKKLSDERKKVIPKINLKEAKEFSEQKKKELSILTQINEAKRTAPKGDGDQTKKRILDLTAELAIVKKVYEEKKKTAPTPKLKLPPPPVKKQELPAKKIIESKIPLPLPPIKRPVTSLPLPPMKKPITPLPPMKKPITPLPPMKKPITPLPLPPPPPPPSKPVVEEVSVVKKVTKKTEEKKPKPEKAMAAKAIPAPVKAAEDVQKSVSASQELNKSAEKGVAIEQTMVNVSSGYLRQQREKKALQEKLNADKQQELSLSEKSTKESEKKSAIKPMASAAVTTPKKVEPAKAPAPQKTVAKQAAPKKAEVKPPKPESISKVVNVQTNIDTAPLDTGLSLIDAMKESNKDDLKTLIEKNRVMIDGLKAVQQQQNVSVAYKKQKREELLQLIEINKEKIAGLDIDKQTQKSILRNQQKQSKRAEAPEPKSPAAAPPPPPPPKATDSSLGGAEPNVKNYQASLQAAKGIAEIAKERAKYDGYANDNQKQNIKLLEKSIAQRESIEASIEAALEEGRDLDSIEKSISKNVQNRVFAQNRLNEFLSAGNIDIAKTEALMADIEKSMKEQISAEAKISKLKTETTYETRSQYDTLVAQGKKHNEIVAIMGKENANSVKSLRAAEDAADKAAIQVETKQKLVSVNQAEYISLKKSIEQYKEIDASLKKELEYEKQMNDKLGLFGKSVKLVGGILDHYGVGKIFKINEALDAMKQKAAAGGNKLQVMLAGLSSIGSNLVKSLTDPLAIITGIVGAFTFLVKKAVEYQSKTFEIAKNLGTSLKTAGELRGKYEGIANANGKLALTTDQLLETQVKMNEQLGFMAPSTAEFATQTTLIMRRFGTSAESMAELQLYAAKTGKTLQSTFATVVGTGKAEAAKLKMHMTEKQILDQVSKVSATVQMNFKGSLKELAAGVVQAQKMGLSLDKINKIGEGLLDFESSVSKEMEAQLLTGKEIDLSKARELALAGDTKGLMAEMNKQIGSQAEYEKMNVIQKQAYAEALGMSKDEMDEMYHKQKMAKELGEKANASQGEQYSALLKKYKTHEKVAEVMGKEAANSAQQASVQEKLSASMSRISEMMGKVGEQLMPIIERVTNWLSNTNNLNGVMETAKSVVKGIGDGLMFAWEAGKKLYEAVSPILGVLKDMAKYLIDSPKLLGAIAAGYVGIKVTMFTLNKLQAAQNFAKKLGIGTSKQQLAKDKEILGTKKKQDLEEKKIGRSKKANNRTANIQGKTEKGTLNTKRLTNTTEKAIGSTKKKNLATSALEGIKEKKNAGLSIVKAISSVVAGSGWLGPAALGVGVLAGTYLYSKLSSAGGGDSGGGDSGGGGGGGSSSDASMGKAEEMNPMNAAAETKKTVNTALTSSKPDVTRGANITIVNNIDPITGKAVQKRIDEDNTTRIDSSKILAPGIK